MNLFVKTCFLAQLFLGVGLSWGQEAPSSPPAALAVPSSPVTPERSTPARVAVELIASSAGAFVGASVGLVSGYLLALPEDCTSGECLRPIFVGAAAGMFLGVPLGAWTGGTLLGGSGGFVPTLVGSTLGFGLSALVAGWADRAQRPIEGGKGLLLLLFPVAGAGLGYELSHDSALLHSRGNSTFRMAPHLSFGGGRGALGLNGQF